MQTWQFVQDYFNSTLHGWQMKQSLIAWAFVFLVGFCLIAYIFRRLEKVNFFQIIPSSYRLERIYFIKSRCFLLWLFFSLLQWSEYAGLDCFSKLLHGGSSFCCFLFFGECGGLSVLLFLKQFSSKNLSTWENFFATAQKLLWTGCVVVGLIVAANNLGYALGGLLTTLGVGGAAIALASRDTFANLWGTISILFDQPFKVGDWIVVGAKASGQVQSIGLRSTRLRTKDDTCLSIPNNVLVNEWIDNWSDFSNLHVQQTFRLNVSMSVDQSNDFLIRARQFLSEYKRVENAHLYIIDNVDGTHNASLAYILKNTNMQDIQNVQEHIQSVLRSLCSHA
ncbi:MAG: mechanosensitive ion channel family protein [Puniceicoccales bacterium]|jgi:small-conductance mechanosensitive channel|nr:mechanosensitive ion channel family protein [Puniceicoccales bacterium]